MTGDQNIARREEFRKILQAWVDYFRDETIPLIKHLLSLGYTKTKVGEVMGLSKQAFSDKYEKYL